MSRWKEGGASLLLATLLIAATACARVAGTHTVAAGEPRGFSDRALLLRQGLNGYQGAEDTVISAARPDEGERNADQLALQANGSAAALLRFDLSALDAQLKLKSARLHLCLQKGPTSPVAVAAYELLRLWDADAVSWRWATADMPWVLPGASAIGVDRADEPVDRAQVSGAGYWVTLDVTALVEKWLADPGSNRGVLVASEGGTRSLGECVFASAQHRRAARRPTLEITLDGQELGEYAGCTDTYLSAVEPEVSHDRSPWLHIRGDGSMVSLLHFDTSGISADARPLQAILRLHVADRRPGSLEVVAFSLARAWNAREATWQRPLAGQQWGVPGAKGPGSDRAPYPAGIGQLGETGERLEIDLTELVAFWVAHPELNDGIILVGRGDEAGCVLASSEHPNVQWRPRLLVVYSHPPAAD